MSGLNPYFGPKPIYVPLVRACDNPETNFQRLRGIWTDPDAEKRRVAQFEFERDLAKKKREKRLAEEKLP